MSVSHKFGIKMPAMIFGFTFLLGGLIELKAMNG